MKTRINQMLIGIKRGQALNLLCENDKDFFDSYLKSEPSAIKRLDEVTERLFMNEELSKVIENLSNNPVLSPLMDINLKYK